MAYGRKGYRKRRAGGISASALLSAMASARRLRSTRAAARLGRGIRATARRAGMGGKFYTTVHPRTGDGPDGSETTYGKSWRSATASQQEARTRANMYGRGLYTGYSGQGSYLTRAQRIARGLGPLAAASGAALVSASGGNPYGTAVGSGLAALGAGASAFGHTRGQGSYTAGFVTGQSASMGDHSAIPQFESMNSEVGNMRITCKEIVRRIYGNPSGTPQVSETWHVSAGLESFAPYLAQHAANFQHYEIKQCIYTYVPMINELGTTLSTGQVGTIHMTELYFDQKPFASYQEATRNNIGSSSRAMISDVCQLGIECEPSKIKNASSFMARRLVRTRPLDVGEKIEDYDFTRVQMLVNDTNEVYANKPIGELWVSYTVEFSNPRIYSGVGKAISKSIFVTDTQWTGGVSIKSCTIDAPFIGIQPVGGDPSPGYLKTSARGYQNSLNLGIVNGLTRVLHPGSNFEGLVFPADTYGDFELTIAIEGLNARPLNVTYQGQITRNSDLFGGRDHTDLGAYEDGTANDNLQINEQFAGIASTPYYCYQVYHFHVNTADVGIDNVVFFEPVVAAENISQIQIVVQEYNPMTTDKNDGQTPNMYLPWLPAKEPIVLSY